MRHADRHTTEPRHPAPPPVQAQPEQPERPAGMQAMNPRQWAAIQAAIRQLAHPS